jgi:hypothetical protein
MKAFVTAIAALALIGMALSYAMRDHIYSYLWPPEVCYTKQGQSIGKRAACLAVGTVVEERSLGDEDAFSKCRSLCAGQPWCTHFVIIRPSEHYQRGRMIVIPSEIGISGCMILKARE